MFINHDMIAIIFKLVNFIFLIGLIAFIFKKYFKKEILFLIAKKESTMQDLITQQTVLEQKQRNLNFLIQEENAECQHLKSKMDEWKKVLTYDQKKQIELYSACIIAIKKRRAEIILKQENQRLQNNVLDIVVSNLEKNLTNDFKDAKRKREYLDDIIHFMKEKTS